MIAFQIQDFFFKKDSFKLQISGHKTRNSSAQILVPSNLD